MPEDLPTIQDVAAAITARGERSHDPSTGKGGTTSDPNLVINRDEPQEKAPSETIVEPVAVAEPKKEPVKDANSVRFGALARKEKEARQRLQDADNRLKAADERERALQEREAKLTGTKFKNPIKLLQEHGFSYQDATNAVLGGFEEAADDPIDVKMRPHVEKFDKFASNTEKLQAELAELKQQLTSQRQQESMQQVVKEINSTLADDKFEYTRSMGEDGVDFVKEVMVEYYKANDRLLDYEEACQIAEDYYENEYLTRLLATKKIQSRLPKGAPQATPSKKPEAKPTLTNDLATGGGAIVDIDKMTKEEAIAYLSKKLQFKQQG
jgi:hypothetical protein